eukprot:COSAG02_NODE_267_length_26570_cov_7.008235_17_plen_163_part_00
MGRFCAGGAAGSRTTPGSSGDLLRGMAAGCVLLLGVGAIAITTSAMAGGSAASPTTASITTGLSPAVTGPVCSITEHGAVGDNSTLCTLAIQTAIDTCSARHPGGSTVVVQGVASALQASSCGRTCGFILLRGLGSTAPPTRRITPCRGNGSVDIFDSTSTH